jgi:hypothetical protein
VGYKFQERNHLKSVVDNYIDQNSLGESLKSTEGVRIISSLRRNRPALPSLEIDQRYFEKVATTNTDGYVKSEMRVYSLSKVPLDEFLAAKNEIKNKASKDPELKAMLNDVRTRQLAGEDEK